jgi:hypothetical protein
MTRSEVKRGDLARALAKRSRATGKQLTEGQARDELDRMVHDIVISLRQGRPAEMPGVGTMTAVAPGDEKAGPAGRHGAKKKAATPGKSKS